MGFGSDSSFLLKVCPEPVLTDDRRFYYQLAPIMDLFQVAFALRMDLMCILQQRTRRDVDALFHLRVLPRLRACLDDATAGEENAKLRRRSCYRD